MQTMRMIIHAIVALFGLFVLGVIGIILWTPLGPTPTLLCLIAFILSVIAIQLGELLSYTRSRLAAK